jgi:hypothetical protein
MPRRLELGVASLAWSALKCAPIMAHMPIIGCQQTLRTAQARVVHDGRAMDMPHLLQGP